MTRASNRIDALRQRGERLCRAGNWTGRIGLCLFGALLTLHWPDPATNEALDSYVSVPEPLFSYLRAHGAGVRDTVAWLLTPNRFGWTIACIIPALFAVHAALKRLVVRRGVRIAMIVTAFLTSPIWVSMVVPHREPVTAPGARTGILVDQAGAPDAKADGTQRAAVPAFHLLPRQLPQPMADQAEFVLAQQAYLDARSGAMVAHLARLSGNWKPAGRDRELLGLMIEHGAARGHSPPAIAAQLAGGVPHSAWRIALFEGTKWLAIICLTVGVALYLVGARRRGMAERFTARLATIAEPAIVAPVTASTPITFGRRNRVPTGARV